MESSNINHVSFFRNSCHYFSAHFSEYEINNLMKLLEPLPTRRVICGLKDVSWDEQTILENTELHDLFLSDKIKDVLSSVVPGNYVENYTFHCWTSLYKRTEYINKHKDKDGDLQILICLKNQALEVSEGLIGLCQNKETRSIQLKPGDMLVFPASKTEHFTTPIKSMTNETEKYVRIVLVARFFFYL